MMFRRVAKSFPNVIKLNGPVRRMGGGHHPAPPKDGLEGAIRKYLPGDEHLALAIIGLYTTIYGVVKLTSGKKKEVAKAPIFSSTSNSHDGTMPSVDSSDFDKWISEPGNFEKLFV